MRRYQILDLLYNTYSVPFMVTKSAITSNMSYTLTVESLLKRAKHTNVEAIFNPYTTDEEITYFGSVFVDDKVVICTSHANLTMSIKHWYDNFRDDIAHVAWSKYIDGTRSDAIFNFKLLLETLACLPDETRIASSGWLSDITVTSDKGILVFKRNGGSGRTIKNSGTEPTFLQLVKSDYFV